MLNRRKFIHRSALSSLLAAIGLGSTACASEAKKATPTTTNLTTKPTVIATWERQTANQTAWQVIKSGGRALDAVEAGVRVLEADENDQSVGYGGRPDRDGKVTLDALSLIHI